MTDWADLELDPADLVPWQRDVLARQRPRPTSVWMSPRDLGPFLLCGVEVSVRQHVEVMSLNVPGSANLIALALCQERSTEHRVEVARIALGTHRLALENGPVLCRGPGRACLLILSGSLDGARILFSAFS